MLLLRRMPADRANSAVGGLVMVTRMVCHSAEPGARKPRHRVLVQVEALQQVGVGSIPVSFHEDCDRRAVS